ncbi:MAG: leucine--tRNA ligase, partial [Elusimicrobia bacterium]|nr:leucine--tRNA ligase [Elusimicrobiota bacterium]
VTVFTTRPATLYGPTYLVLAPEHPLVETITATEFKGSVSRYIESARHKSDLERTEMQKLKTGVPTGALAVSPVSGRKIPVWIADYVLASYGTGAIMAVPAHDQRDWEFAVRHELPIKKVVEPPAEALKADPSLLKDKAFTEDGVACYSEAIDGLPTPQAKARMTAWLEEKGVGRRKVTYRLRDWVFSRQRYWGEPIPVVHCPKCGIVPVPEEKLPILLPDVRHYKPTGTGESPLADVHSWVNTHCPGCHGAARRETNTMPQWAGSCWYYLRYLDPRNAEKAFEPANEKAWMPVDCYIGGAEHAVLHLLYARFWHKVLFDLGPVSTKEPFQKLRHQGMILSFSYRDPRGVYHGYGDVEHGTDGKARLAGTGEELAVQVEKMSKSKKNVVNPDEVLDKHGADVFRLYEMFMGPFADAKPWDMKDIMGRVRFLRRVWVTFAGPERLGADEGLVALRHRTVKKVGEDIEALHFNTAISALDIYLNGICEAAKPARADAEAFLTLLNPFAPHVTEELWERLGNEPFLSARPWPVYDPERLKESSVEVVVQVNGKVRAKLIVEAGAGQEALKASALALPKILEETRGRAVVKVIVVPDKLVNVVVK